MQAHISSIYNNILKLVNKIILMFSVLKYMVYTVGDTKISDVNRYVLDNVAFMSTRTITFSIITHTRNKVLMNIC